MAYVRLVRIYLSYKSLRNGIRDEPSFSHVILEIDRISLKWHRKCATGDGVTKSGVATRRAMKEGLENGVSGVEEEEKRKRKRKWKKKNWREINAERNKGRKVRDVGDIHLGDPIRQDRYVSRRLTSLLVLNRISKYSHACQFQYPWRSDLYVNVNMLATTLFLPFWCLRYRNLISRERNHTRK